MFGPKQNSHAMWGQLRTQFFRAEVQMTVQYVNKNKQWFIK